MSAPVRVDLAAVRPLYYPIVEHSRFGSIKAMCRRFGLAEAEVQGYVDRARLEQFDIVVLDRLVLRKAESVDCAVPVNVALVGEANPVTCAVLVLKPGGAVMLCAGLFAELTQDEADAQALAAAFAEHPDFKGRFIAVGEFRPNAQGALQ
jgi:hypothetical protein